MPMLYEYFGLIIMFYANELDPVHVHGKCQGRESRAELVIIDGLGKEIRILRQPGRSSLSDSEQRYFEEIVSAKADDMGDYARCFPIEDIYRNRITYIPDDKVAA